MNACIKEAVELDDNVDEFKDGRPMGLGDSGSDQSLETRVIVRPTQQTNTTPQVPTVQKVANEIMRQMNINQKPPVRTEPLQQQALYPNNQAQMQNANQQQGYQPLPRVLKWCNIEKKYTNHETHECYFRPRYKN